MKSSWREFTYVMGANFQAFFLLVSAHELGVACRDGDYDWLCPAEPFFLPAALVVSGFVYYKVFYLLLKPKKKE